MAIETFNRYENKYLLNQDSYEKFYHDLLAYMEVDEHNKLHGYYTITNIYFDTAEDSIIRNSLSKPKYKEKLRLRAYGVPQGEDMVYLEMKKKVFGLVNKRRTALKLSEAYEFVCDGIEPEFKKYMNKQVIQEIKYFLSRYELKPKLYLSYDRKALFSKESRDLRITFDTNILTRRVDVKLESGNYGQLLLAPNQYLMEIKAEKTIPFWLSKLLSEHKLYRTSFSKYGNEFKNYVKNNKQ